MIIGGSKVQVIENIKTNILNNELNKKVEVGDPNLTQEELNKVLEDFFNNKKKLTYKTKNVLAKTTIKPFGNKIYNLMEIDGLENLEGIDFSHGAIITSNHFNPLDSFCPRKVVEDILNKKMYIVVQDTNLAMTGDIGFLFNYLDVLPISKNPNYIVNTFRPELKKILDNGNVVLIYPEEEMWFNYRKPRPCKRGAYLFAAEYNVPVISLFVEIVDLDEDDNDEFKKVKYKVHILKTIKSDSSKSDRANSKEMALIDYEQKKRAYEDSYHQKLDYTFVNSDIAGWKL